MQKQLKQHLSINPGKSTGVFVIQKDISFAIREWKRLVKEAGTVNSLKERREYKKPSEKKREIKQRAIYYNKKETT